ncbi:hypothetical protein LA345_39160 (plasmid) [Burkholderia vietnamiensis]|uniref:Uncharacterized protein n=1 Tax=Burkholderia vietnamiensis (strain G4 / LMG 22486) TaxID=269482 RepID=A4JWJ1_BURVG|nr:hypothetical protein Bcep1808_7774 [Burkholderia vietnamiensis G4]MCB4349820.1 hypothetical protein [Burkholderia vietnamiensis]
MGKKTGKIVYNVHERGREHVGKERLFDLRALASLVNGDAVQEKVRNRDLLGYYGHSIRVKFGIEPPEWAMVNGKQIFFEPAVVTTYLCADENGNIEHETEFLDTEPGKMAARLHDSKAGGFSSAIQAVPNGLAHVPKKFGGFDYVHEPNYTTNRGYVFDSASGELDMNELVFDSVMTDMHHQQAAMNLIFDSLQADHTLAMQALERLREENEELLSLLSAARPGVVLDSAREHQAPTLTGRRATADFERRANSFASASLVSLDTLKEGDENAGAAYARKYFGA